MWGRPREVDEPQLGVDVGELETLFTARRPKKDDIKPQAAPVKKPKGCVDMKRSNNILIALARLKIDFGSLRSIILTAEDDMLSLDNLQAVRNCLPTMEEMKTVREYSEGGGELGDAERFFLEMTKVPNAAGKVDALIFRRDFAALAEGVQASLDVFDEVCRKLKGSEQLARILEIILALGNILNRGTARAHAAGFKLKSLEMLKETRASNRSTTLLHYLAKTVKTKSAELLDFPSSLGPLDEAAKLSQATLQSDQAALKRAVEKTRTEVDRSGGVPACQPFHDNMLPFVEQAEGKAAALAARLQVTKELSAALVAYFGEPGSSVEDVIKTLGGFSKSFLQAVADNVKNEVQADAAGKGKGKGR